MEIGQSFHFRIPENGCGFTALLFAEVIVGQSLVIESALSHPLLVEDTAAVVLGQHFAFVTVEADTGFLFPGDPL